MDIEIKILGEEALAQRIKALVDVAESKHIRQALREASRPVIEDAKARAPSKVIARGIRFIRAVRKQGAIVAEIGLPGGRKPWYHGLFVERGTGPRMQKKTKRSTGSMPARPFLRPAFAAKARAVSETFFLSLKRRMEKAARG